MEDAESALMFNDVPSQSGKLAAWRPKDYDLTAEPAGREAGGGGASAPSPPPSKPPPSAPRPSSHHRAIAAPSEAPVTIAAPPKIAGEWGRVPRLPSPDGRHQAVRGLPTATIAASETQARQILQAVGALKSFVARTGRSPRGHCFFEYADARLTGIAQEALTGVSLDAGVDDRVHRAAKSLTRLVCRVADPTSAAEGKETRRDVPKFTDAALFGGGAPRRGGAGNARDVCAVGVQRGDCGASRGGRIGHREKPSVKLSRACAGRRRARRSGTKPIESSRPDGNGYLVLAFQEGGGVGSADSGRNAADAAAQCASRLNGRTFEERELFVRYAPLS